MTLYKLSFTLLKILYEYVHTRGIQIFCPFAVNARRTTLIFVEIIAFHQTSLLDDVHKVLTVFTGHTVRFCIFLVYPSYTEKQQIWSYIDIE